MDKADYAEEERHFQLSLHFPTIENHDVPYVSMITVHNAAIRGPTHSPHNRRSKRPARVSHHNHPLSALHHPVVLRQRPVHKYSGSRQLRRWETGKPFTPSHAPSLYTEHPTHTIIPTNPPSKHPPLTRPLPTETETYQPHPRHRPPRQPLLRRLYQTLQIRRRGLGPDRVRPRGRGAGDSGDGIGGCDCCGGYCGGGGERVGTAGGEWDTFLFP